MYEPYMEHSGIKGMHWGVRRYQNPDGSLTPAGRDRYGVGPARKVKTTVGRVIKGVKRGASNAVSRVKKIAATRKKKSIEKLIRSGDIEKLAKKASKLNNSQLDDAIARANKISVAKNTAGPQKDLIDKIERVIGTMDKGAKMAKNIYDYKNAKMDYKKKQQELHNLIAGVEKPKKKKGGNNQNQSDSKSAEDSSRKKKPDQDLQNARDESNKKVDEAIKKAKKNAKPSYGERVAAERHEFAERLAARSHSGIDDAIASAKRQAAYDRIADRENKRHEFAAELAKNAQRRRNEDYVDKLMERARRKVDRRKKRREFWYG